MVICHSLLMMILDISISNKKMSFLKVNLSQLLELGMTKSCEN